MVEIKKRKVFIPSMILGSPVVIEPTSDSFFEKLVTKFETCPHICDNCPVKERCVRLFDNIVIRSIQKTLDNNAVKGYSTAFSRLRNEAININVSSKK